MCLPDGVTAHPKACDPWLKKLVDTGFWAADEILFTPMAGSLSSTSLTTNLLL